MSKRLFVGKLPWAIREEELKQLFSEYASVVSAQVIVDRESGRSKGFGFVEMSDDAEAMAACDKLNGMDVSGMNIVVNEARPKEDRPQGGGFGGGSSYGGNRGGNGGGGGGGFGGNRGGAF